MCWQENCRLLSQQQESEECFSASRPNTEQLQQVVENLIFSP